MCRPAPKCNGIVFDVEITDLAAKRFAIYDSSVLYDGFR
jgi:hypothetical protein